MAVNGTGGAYSYTKLEKLDNNVSQGLQYWGGLAAQRGAEDRLREEREGIRKKQEIVDWEEKWNMKETDFINKVTGFDNYDDVARDGANHIMTKYNEYNRAARQALDSGDLTKQSEYNMRMLKLKSSFKNVNQFQEHFAKLNQEYVKMANEGKISGVDSDWEKIMQSIITGHNITFRTDENDNLVYLGFYEDENKVKQKFEIKQSDMINGTFRPYQRQQIAGKGGLVDNIVQNLGKMKKETSSGYNITSSQVWDEERKVATKDYIDSLLKSDEVMADLYYQVSNGQSKKRDNFTDDEKKIVEEKLLNLVRAGYDEEIGYKFNSGKASNDRQVEQNRETKRYHIAQEGLAAAKERREGKEWQMEFDRKLTENRPFVMESTNASKRVFRNTEGEKHTADFKTYDMFAPDGKKRQFIYGYGKDENGKTIPLVTNDIEFSVDSDGTPDGKWVRFKNPNSKSEDGYDIYSGKSSRNDVYQTLINQVLSPDVDNRREKSSSSGSSSGNSNSTTNSNKNQTIMPILSIDEIQKKYNIL